jgi:uncharacterized protein (TIGR03067 family)
VLHRRAFAILLTVCLLGSAACRRAGSEGAAHDAAPPPASVTALPDVGERTATDVDARAAAVESDYDALTGSWQLVRSVVDGVPVPEAEVRKTILITDRDEFRFPADAGVGTAPLGKFTIDPLANPKQVDSTSFSGPDKGQVSLGIYEIIDAENKRACWAKPGKPRPTSFDSTPGSGWTVQDWRLVTKDVGTR